MPVRPGRRTQPRRRTPAALVATAVVAVAVATAPAPAASTPAAATGAAVGTAAALPAGFVDEVVVGGLVNPTVVRFSPDGRVFVAEKSGLVKVFDGTTDTTATVFADLRTNVHNFWDRGLLGMAVHPAFPTNPNVYVLYTHDAAIGGTAPRWGTVGGTSDACPTPPGPTGDGCVVSGRLSRVDGTGEHVLVEGWCQQYPSHSVGSLAFGADGMLYASGGDGASFNFTDWGQDGSPVNPCGDPPSGVGATLTPPTAEGGALRSQDLRTTADPVGLSGTVIRVDPATGAGAPGNPLAASTDANARRIVATGLRNPFRMTVRPGTNDVWLADVGWGGWEEIDRIPAPADASADNLGWPCYEGAARQSGYDGADLQMCEGLYGAGPSAVSPPVLAYRHDAAVVPGEAGCSPAGSSVAGVAFYDGVAFPAAYHGALFFADYSRDCIWVVFPGADGLPDPSTVQPFAAPAANPVNLEVGPDGALYYPDFDGGTIRRIRSTSAPTTCPAGQFTAQYFPNTALSGTPTATVCDPTVDESWGSGGPAGVGVGTDRFSVRWTGQFDFAADVHTFSATADDGVRVWLDDRLVIDRWVDQSATTHTAAVDVGAGRHTVRVEYYENTGQAVARVAWARSTANDPPAPVVATPAEGTQWAVGDTVAFSGSATDPEDGALPASALSWSLVLQHCPTSCHSHELQTFAGVASGSFVAPDHEYPSHLELRLTATDAGGQQRTVTRRLDPRTVDLTFASSPPGLELQVGSSPGTSPFTRRVVVGSANTVTAPGPQSVGGVPYDFAGWSDGGDRSHTIVAPAAAATYTATYAAGGEWQPYVNVNFQPAAAAAVPGYLVDGGAAYGPRRNGWTYGWNARNANARDRDSALSPDQRYDTFNQMQRGGTFTWEIAVPDGEYEVRVVAGDPKVVDAAYRMAAEGVIVVDGQPTRTSRWVDGTAVVTVADGRLTITSATGARDNRIDFVEIRRPG